MNAFVLTAGKGTRLGDAAEGKPKPLVEIGGRPLLSIIVERLRQIGIEHIFLNSHYLPEQLVNFRLTSPFKDQITILHEKELLGTAGTIKAFLKIIPQDELLVMHGDNFFDDNLMRLKDAFRELTIPYQGVVGTFLTADPSQCGIFKIGTNHEIQELHEKTEPIYGDIANAAIYIFNRGGLAEFGELSTFESDISRHLLPRLLNKLIAVPLDGHFIDIGTPENLQKARQVSIRN
jgi:mannose-1-phosphate guanylyltransferase